MADDTTTTSASATLAPACPIAIVTPERGEPVGHAPSAGRRTRSRHSPRLARSSAMPLMPMPPIPTKCTRRVRPEQQLHDAANAMTRSTIRAAASGRAKRPHRPSLIASSRPGSPANAADCRRPASRPSTPARSSSSGRAGIREHLRVLALMVVGRRRKRHQHRRPSRGGQLGQRRRAGAANHDRRAPSFRRPPGRGTAPRARRDRRARTRHGRLPRREAPVWWTIPRPPSAPRQPRRCRHHGHVDRVRALGAAKD